MLEQVGKIKSDLLRRLVITTFWGPAIFLGLLASLVVTAARSMLPLFDYSSRIIEQGIILWSKERHVTAMDAKEITENYVFMRDLGMSPFEVVNDMIRENSKKQYRIKETDLALFLNKIRRDHSKRVGTA